LAWVVCLMRRTLRVRNQLRKKLYCVTNLAAALISKMTCVNGTPRRLLVCHHSSRSPAYSPLL